MDKENLKSIYDKYIERFYMFNDPEHGEYYKWEIANKFPDMMKQALTSPDDLFSKELLKVKKLTENIIDNWTTPFYGLCKLAEQEPGAVRDLFNDLYAEDGGGIRTKQKKIIDFIDRSNKLSENHYPGSYLYKNDLHSVTGYLFLNDPDNNYLYKATHCNIFADCIGFYESWGSKNDFDLSVFYRMCDQVLEEIKQYQPLLEKNALRYDGRFNVELHPDRNLHILLFDIIYCCFAYGLYEGMKFERTSRSTTNEQAKISRIKVEQARKDAELYQEQLATIADLKKRVCAEFTEESNVVHKALGNLVIKGIDTKNATILAVNENGVEKKIGLLASCMNGLLPIKEELLTVLKENSDILNNEKRIESGYREANNILELYRD